MAGFRVLIGSLRRAEQQLARQLEGIRTAISSLEMGGAVSPGFRRSAGRPKGSGRKPKRRKMSAAARAKISAAQKARWAKVRADKKK